jgi:hypothetical protein
MHTLPCMTYIHPHICAHACKPAHTRIRPHAHLQMVSLLKLAEITEEGVNFESPLDGSRMLLTPEHSIGIQNRLGADIIMQLDDVVPSTTVDPQR